MKKFILIFVLVFQVSALWAVDLLDLRVFPLFASQTVAFDGVIVNNSYKSEGTGLRAKLSGLRSKWLKTGKVVVESDTQKITADITEGEFSGTIKVSSLASFSLRVHHEEKQLYSENFSFPGNADFIVVSDIDDTILITEVTSRLKMAYNSMFKDIDKRLAVDGTPDFYREIGSGTTGMGRPHFVYLSSSPAFLSRSLKAFLLHNKFPAGTLILKKSLTSGDHADHKTGWLNKILERYSGKPLLLFGDSGEKDPFIYRSFVENNANPSRVKGIIIREVTGSSEKIATLSEFRDSLRDKCKVPFIYWKKIETLRQNMHDDGLLSDSAPLN